MFNALVITKNDSTQATSITQLDEERPVEQVVEERDDRDRNRRLDHAAEIRVGQTGERSVLIQHRDPNEEGDDHADASALGGRMVV